MISQITNLELEDDLLGGLRLLVEHRLGLATEARLLAVVTALALSGNRVLALQPGNKWSDSSGGKKGIKRWSG